MTNSWSPCRGPLARFATALGLAVALLPLGYAHASRADASTVLGAQQTYRYDRAYLKKTGNWVRRDMRTVQNWMRDGIDVDMALDTLSQSYTYMTHAGVPPKIKSKSTYLARITTLSSFAEQAANVYDADAAKGEATYAVIRKETGILFRQINKAAGLGLQLPPCTQHILVCTQ